MKEKPILARHRIGFSFFGFKNRYKKFLPFGSILTLISGIAFANAYEAEKVVSEYEAEVRIDRNPPVVGDNPVEIEVKDARGKPVTDAKVLASNYVRPIAQNGAAGLHHGRQVKRREIQCQDEFHHMGSLDYCNKDNPRREDIHGQVQFRRPIRALLDFTLKQGR